MTAVAALPLLDAAAARAGDEAAVAAGDTWAALMLRAAGHLARGVVAAGGGGYGLRVAILVGKGNNGGDGWAAAHLLRDRHGATCWVLAPDGTEVELSTEAAAHRAAWLDRGGRTSTGVGDLDAALGWADVAVDALLGTGIRGAPRGPAGDAAAALLRAHDAGTLVVACDVPSGVSSDDGSAPDGAVRADVTVTFGGLKRGLLLHPGAAHAGRVLVGDLGSAYVPPETGWAALTPAGAIPPPLPVDADKRARGVVLAVAGAVGTAGAAALCAEGALRAGAGLVTVATPGPVRGEVAATTDRGVMVRGVAADDAGAIAGPDELPDLAGFDVVVAGPGLGHGAGAAAAVAQLRADAPALVLDADALNVHRDAPDHLADHAGPLVLTPHERELARIGGGDDGPDAWSHRVERVPALARRYDATIVAKGPGTLVAAPDGRVWVCPSAGQVGAGTLGGPALGSGGTGDALAGIVAAAIARADDVPLAVARAVWWHAAAGARAGADRAGRATATDLLAQLPGVLGDLAATGAQPTRPGVLPWDAWVGEEPR
ncbi:NAD(P)H-hydrate dehydratase [Nitriliruptoraceae bacterium ZYF776]|nr:NAD(P)H-hydrate dehydratase [Profundirhabdus halotolerans]